MTKTKSAKSKVNAANRKKKVVAEPLPESPESATESPVSEEENLKKLAPTISLTDTVSMDNDGSSEDEVDEPPAATVSAKVTASDAAKSAKQLNMSDRAEHMRSIASFNRHRGIHKKSPRSMSQKAGLILPVLRIRRALTATFSGKMMIQKGEFRYTTLFQ